MKKTTADTIKSVIVLTVIAFVCVGLLAVCNEFMKYTPTLDGEMAKQLYKVCPTGESTDENALDYFEILDIEDKINQVNKDNKSTGGKVLAVYRAKKGTNAGRYVIQAQASGRDGDIIMITSYDANGKIMKTLCYAQNESYWNRLDESKLNDITGLDGSVTQNELQAITGATIKLTLNGIAKALTVSNAMASVITGA